MHIAGCSGSQRFLYEFWTFIIYYDNKVKEHGETACVLLSLQMGKKKKKIFFSMAQIFVCSHYIVIKNS